MKILKKQKKEKKRFYDSRITNVEHGTFTPLVFSATGGEVPDVSIFHKYIAQKIFAKTVENYGRVLSLKTLLININLLFVKSSYLLPMSIFDFISIFLNLHFFFILPENIARCHMILTCHFIILYCRLYFDTFYFCIYLLKQSFTIILLLLL